MYEKMMLPELNLLSPTKTTTFSKLVEEVAECNSAVYDLRIFERAGFSINLMDLSDEEIDSRRKTLRMLIQDVMGEIMDVAQVCATQLYAFEKDGVDIQSYFKECNETLVIKIEGGLKFIEAVSGIYASEGNSSMDDIDSVMNSITWSMGTIAQLGKKLGVNGEKKTVTDDEGQDVYIQELVSIILKALNLLGVLKLKYNIDVDALSKAHVAKLIERGYIALDKSA